MQMSGEIRYSDEVRARAVWMVFEHQVPFERQAGVIAAIAPEIGCIPQTLREWVKQAEKDRSLRALLADRQARQVWVNNLAPHLPVQGFSFLARKSLATASFPILACRSFICSSSVVNGRLRHIFEARSQRWHEFETIPMLSL
jgi:transposase-like protein